MILVPVEVRPSGIHGNGIFATAPIPKGTPFWRYTPGFDQAYSPTEWAAMPEVTRNFLRHFAYFDSQIQRMILSGDHARFMNHSSTPNTGTLPDAEPPVVTVTLDDIEAGEELTCDYWAFDGDSPWKFGRVPKESQVGAT